MDDEPKVQQLENRIDSLESTIEKMMPSRRDALKMGGAALAGGSLMAGTASAGTNQVGTIGSASQPVDVNAEDIDAVSLNTGSVTIDGRKENDPLELIAEATSANSIDVDISGLAIRQRIVIEVFVANTANNSIQARLDGDNSSTYDVLELSNAGITEVTGATEWNLLSPTREGFGRWQLVISPDVDFFEPLISGSAAVSGMSNSTLLRGQAARSLDGATTLNLFAAGSDPSIRRAKVYKGIIGG
jgi:hypothetical protein